MSTMIQPPPRGHIEVSVDTLEQLADQLGGSIHPTPGGGWATLSAGVYGIRYAAWVPAVTEAQS